MSSDDRNSLAEQRTDWAEDRTLLANERTHAGWMRTGFASVGVGLAVQAIFNRVEPVWLAKAVATAFFAVGVVIFYLAYRKACAMLSRLDNHTARPVERNSLRGVCAMVTAATLLLAGLLWWF